MSFCDFRDFPKIVKTHLHAIPPAEYSICLCFLPPRDRAHDHDDGFTCRGGSDLDTRAERLAKPRSLWPHYCWRNQDCWPHLNQQERKETENFWNQFKR